MSQSDKRVCRIADLLLPKYNLKIGFIEKWGVHKVKAPFGTFGFLVGGGNQLNHRHDSGDGGCNLLHSEGLEKCQGHRVLAIFGAFRLLLGGSTNVQHPLAKYEIYLTFSKSDSV